MKQPIVGRLVAAVIATLGLNACGDATSPIAPPATLTVTGAAAAPATVANHPNVSASPTDTMVTNGDPSSIRVGVYTLWISQNADCSAPQLVQDHGPSAVQGDLMANPVLFSGSPANGTYACILIKMSDVVQFRSASTFGTCQTDVDYRQDIYRHGESDWKDANLNSIIGHGTDGLPVDDQVTLVLTTSLQAAVARGFSQNQVIPLQSPLSVPAASTFYWNGQGTVTSLDGRPCGLEPGRPSFQ